jgi:hypothetical protein
VEPQLFKYLGKVDPDTDAGSILNSLTGLYSLFNQMRIFSQLNASTYKGITNSDLLSYVQSVILDVDFDGIYLKKKSVDMFNGYRSKSIEYKRNMNDTLGGASWLSSQVSLIQLKNKPTKFNTINTGIYDSNRIRQISIVEGSVHSSSEYQAFKSEYENVKQVFISDKEISGTNLLGFQNKIQEFDSIEGYFDMTYSAQTLMYKSTLQWKDSQGR